MGPHLYIHCINDLEGQGIAYHPSTKHSIQSHTTVAFSMSSYRNTTRSRSMLVHPSWRNSSKECCLCPRVDLICITITL
uniref:Uncharacterized protein n=1 Tax=Arundo donax TaxID=35708 RepID=A0A0A9HB50_ARUDO